MKSSKDKKKFKDTKIGAFLKNKAPKILNAVGDILPDNGTYGIVKKRSQLPGIGTDLPLLPLSVHNA